MSLSHYLFRDMQRAMDVFDQAFSKPNSDLIVQGSSSFSRFPVSDLIETPEGYELHAELPGYDKKNINVTLNDNRTLVLSGSHETHESGKASQEEVKDDGRQYWVRERVSGSFKRSFSFPASIDPDSFKASFKNGVLKITVSKAVKNLPRQIHINKL